MSAKIVVTKRNDVDPKKQRPLQGNGSKLGSGGNSGVNSGIKTVKHGNDSSVSVTVVSSGPVRFSPNPQIVNGVLGSYVGGVFVPVPGGNFFNSVFYQYPNYPTSTTPIKYPPVTPPIRYPPRPPIKFPGGSVIIKVPRNLTLLFKAPVKTHQYYNGIIVLAGLVQAAGAVTNFAIWGANSSDPDVMYVESATNLTSGGVGQAFTRNSAVFVPQRKTAYLAVGSTLFSVPNTGANRNQYMKKWMVEKRPVGTTAPSPTYLKARQVQVNVRPDRLNYARNPGFEEDVTHCTPVGDPSVLELSTTAKYGSESLNVVSTNSGTTLGFETTVGTKMRPGYWTISLWARSPERRTAVLSGEFSDPSLEVAVSATATLLPDVWTRLHFIFRLNEVASIGTFRLVATSEDSHSAGASLLVDGVLVEATDTLLDYFDGDTSDDTMWEAGGTPGLSRSYLYNRRAARVDALLKSLEDNVPLGIGIATPLLGNLPPIDSSDDY